MAHTTADELTYVSFPISKYEEDADGNLVVEGIVTDGSVDTDRQIVSPQWSAKALTTWMDSGPNLRVMHSPHLYPAGRGLQVDLGDFAHTLKGLIVEDTAKKLVKNKVLRAWSVGISNPVIRRDPSGKAAGGLVEGGELCEVSLVDRPANRSCQLTLAKSEDHEVPWTIGDLDDLLAKAAGGDVDDEPGDQDSQGTGSDEEVDQADIVKAGDGGSEDDSVDDEDGDAGDDDGGEAVKAAFDGSAALKAAGDAYRAERKAWLDAEPSYKDVIGGTEYLAKRAEWQRWDARGGDEGLDGTREGAGRWLAAQGGTYGALTLVKAASGAGPGEDAGETPDSGAGSEPADAADEDAGAEAGKAAGPEAAKRDISTGERKRLASQGHALPDGSYPIASAGDLQNAAVLARSGHGNVTAAKKLIARRARELGVANPLKDGKKARKAAALSQLAETVGKSVATGLITADAAEAIFAAAGLAGSEKGTRPLPSDTRSAGMHREPDGTTGVEVLEHQADMHTDPDRRPDNVPDAVWTGPMAGKAQEGEIPQNWPYAAKRMHDAFCAAYDPAEVLAEYPAMKSAADAADAGWFTGEAARAVQAGDSAKAAELTALAASAGLLKGAEPAALADAAASLHKAFTDMYPDERCSPSQPPKPGSYERPYLTSGHAAENAAHNGGPDIPSPAHTPEPEQFDRGLITAGHEADSPANRAPNNRGPVGTGASRTYYTNNARDAARAAMQSVHDHISAQFPDMCPMASSRKADMSDDMNASASPRPVSVSDQGGVPGVGKGESLAGPADGAAGGARAAHQDAGTAPGEAGGKKKRRKMSKYELMAEAARHGLVLTEPLSVEKAAELTGQLGVVTDAEAVKALVAEQIAPLAEAYERQIAGLRKQVEDLGSQPDPALSPVRGQMARGGAAAPVEKRSLVDEHATRVRVRDMADREEFESYVEMQSRSGDPKVRERALAVLDKMAAVRPAA